MRSALQHPHRHLAVRIPDGHAIRQHQSAGAVGDDIPYETGVIRGIGFGGVDGREVAEQRARDGGRPHVRADVDHHAADGQFACLENFAQRQAALSLEPRGYSTFRGLICRGSDAARETTTTDRRWSRSRSGRWIRLRDRGAVRMAARGKRRLAGGAPVMVRGDRGRVPKRQYVFQHDLVRLRGPRAQPARLETPAQYLAQPLGSIEALPQQVSLAAALRQLGVEAPPAGQAGDEVAEEERESHSVPASPLCLARRAGPRHGGGGVPRRGRHAAACRVNRRPHHERAVRHAAARVRPHADAARVDEAERVAGNRKLRTVRGRVAPPCARSCDCGPPGTRGTRSSSRGRRPPCARASARPPGSMH